MEDKIEIADYNGRITHLSFCDALKYAYLGDRIFRVGAASRRSSITEDFLGEVALTGIRDEFDVCANDWIAEETGRSV